MPDDPYWESLFDLPLILSPLGITQFSMGNVIDLPPWHFGLRFKRSITPREAIKRVAEAKVAS
jgi:hypothetical protein